jgi:isoquinoline 1-oxidoreductase alpha subunit
MINVLVNGQEHRVEADPAMPLLWVLRDPLGLTGTKYGGGISRRGACTVRVEGKPLRSCTTPVSVVGGKSITAVEGLSKDRSHPVQQAWIEEQVPQCGYCQCGQILAAVALLQGQLQPSDADIDAAMSGVPCRCGTYPRIRRAIRRTAAGKPVRRLPIRL